MQSEWPWLFIPTIRFGALFRPDLLSRLACHQEAISLPPRPTRAHRQHGAGRRMGWQGLPASNHPGVGPGLRIVRDTGKQPAQLNRGRQLAFLEVDGADGGGFSFGDAEHAPSMAFSAPQTSEFTPSSIHPAPLWASSAFIAFGTNAKRPPPHERFKRRRRLIIPRCRAGGQQCCRGCLRVRRRTTTCRRRWRLPA